MTVVYPQILSSRVVSFILVVVGTVLATSAQGAPREVRYKDIPLEFADAESLVVSGWRATVRLVPAAGGTGLRPGTVAKSGVLKTSKILPEKATESEKKRFEAMTFIVHKKNNAVVIEANGPESDSDWSEWMQPGGPELVFEIEAPQVPVEVSLREGSFNVQNWKQPVSATLVNGTIKTHDTEGVLRLQALDGQIQIDSHRGRIEVDSYDAKVVAKKIDGELTVTNFSGISTMNSIKGNLAVLAYSGPVAIEESEGALEFSTGRGALALQEFEGPVNGKSDAGSVTASIEGEAEVKIESNEGEVAVRLPASSGAAVQISTEEGAVHAPQAVSPNASKKGKSAQGQLSGAGPKGNVSIKTKTGTVRVR